MTEPQRTEGESRQRPGWAEMIRGLVHASLGAGAWLQDRAEAETDDWRGNLRALVQRLVDKGELAELDGRALMSDLLATPKRLAEESRAITEERLDAAIGNVLSRMRIATRSDIERLEQRIEELSNRLAGDDTTP